MQRDGGPAHYTAVVNETYPPNKWIWRREGVQWLADFPKWFYKRARNCIETNEYIFQHLISKPCFKIFILLSKFYFSPVLLSLDIYK